MNMIQNVQTKHWALMGLVAAVMIIAMATLAGCGGNSSSSSSAASSSASASASSSASASGSATASGDFDSLSPVTLIGADSTAKDSAGNKWFLAFNKELESITGGKLTVNYQGTGALGGDADLVRQEVSGDIDIYVGQPAAMVSTVPELAVMDLPMAFATYDADQIEKVMNGDNAFTKDLQAAYEKAGVHNLAWLQAATYRQTTSNKELKTLADYKGFQIRTMENKNHMAFWSAVGAEPTPLAWAEVYFALQNGTVDGQENATDTCVSASLQEVQKYLARTNHILYANNMSINKAKWDSLDPAYQKAIEDAVAAANKEIAPTLAKLDADSTKKMTDAGVTEITYDEQFYADYKDACKGVYEDISKQTNGLSDTLVAELEKTAK
jgi:tripartite ATP-independent transporter DctP family solute receptor